MSKCFLCGCSIDPGSRATRRKVKTGEIMRRKSGRLVGPATVRFGMRVVCPRCAKTADKEWKRHERIQLIELTLALIAILWFVVLNVF